MRIGLPSERRSSKGLSCEYLAYFIFLLFFLLERLRRVLSVWLLERLRRVLSLFDSFLVQLHLIFLFESSKSFDIKMHYATPWRRRADNRKCWWNLWASLSISSNFRPILQTLHFTCVWQDLFRACTSRCSNVYVRTCLFDTRLSCSLVRGFLAGSSSVDTPHTWGGITLRSCLRILCKILFPFWFA